MKIRRKTNYYMTVENVEPMGQACGGYKWAGSSKSGLPIYYSEAEWEEVLEEKSNLVWIRSKNTGAMIRAKTVLAGNSSLRWFTMNIEKGTETFYSSDVWEEVMPAERWNDVQVGISQDMSLLHFEFSLNNLLNNGMHTFHLPNGHRFVALGDGSFKIQRKVQS